MLSLLHIVVDSRGCVDILVVYSIVVTYMYDRCCKLSTVLIRKELLVCAAAYMYVCMCKYNRLT